MKTFSSACMIAVLSTFAAGSIAADPFERLIRPLLHEYCVTCHRPRNSEENSTCSGLIRWIRSNAMPTSGMLSKYLDAAKEVS